MKYHLVDIFSNRPYSGNGLTVFIDAGNLKKSFTIYAAIKSYNNFKYSNEKFELFTNGFTQNIHSIKLLFLLIVLNL